MKESARELQLYKMYIRRLADQRINELFLNSDKDHALAVLTEMFSHAEHNVYIFAGNLCSDITNDGEYIDALGNFIERGGTANIILNRFNIHAAFCKPLFYQLASYQEENRNVIVKTTPKSINISQNGIVTPIHFTLADNAYRIETDTKKMSATCNMNDENVTNQYAKLFNKLSILPDTEDVKLNELWA